MAVSSRALNLLSAAIRRLRRETGSRWRRLDPGRQALLALAHLRKGETYADLAGGFGVGIRTVYRYVREGIDLLAALAPTLEQAIAVAQGKAYVILDGSLLRIDRVMMASGRDRPFYSGKWKAHGVNVQVIADRRRPAHLGLTRPARRPPRRRSRPAACDPRRPGRRRRARVR